MGGRPSPIETGDRLNQWQLYSQAGCVDGAHIFSELCDDPLFALIHSEERLRHQGESDSDYDRTAYPQKLVRLHDYLVAAGGSNGVGATFADGVTVPPTGRNGISRWLMSLSTMSLSISDRTLSTVSRWSRSRVTSFAFSYSASTLRKRAASPCASRTRFSLYPSASRRICWAAPRARGSTSAW